MEKAIKTTIRVLSLPEICATYGLEAVWMETRETLPHIALYSHETSGCLMMYDSIFGLKKWRKDLYGSEWRCWSRRPDQVMAGLEPWVPAE